MTGKKGMENKRGGVEEPVLKGEHALKTAVKKRDTVGKQRGGRSKSKEGIWKGKKRPMVSCLKKCTTGQGGEKRGEARKMG